MSNEKIKSNPVVAIQEVAVCTKTPKCKGELVFTGQGSTLGMTTTFQHKCPKCGEVHLLLDVFPRIVYKLSKKGKRK